MWSSPTMIRVTSTRSIVLLQPSCHVEIAVAALGVRDDLADGVLVQDERVLPDLAHPSGARSLARGDSRFHQGSALEPLLESSRRFSVRRIPARAIPDDVVR